MEIGVQFYTLREHCKNIDDFAETLKKVADIGYKNVQISGVCDYEPEWLAENLKKKEIVRSYLSASSLSSILSQVLNDETTQE